MAKPEFGDRTLEQLGAVADYCRAAETLQRAESRCAALGVHPRSRSERVQFLALIEKMDGPPRAGHDA
jgi:hypothetical protein